MKGSLLCLAAVGVLSAGVSFGSAEMPNVAEGVAAIKSVQTVNASKEIPRGGKCYGLFVGVNKYNSSMSSAGAFALNGCVNDAYNMRDAWTDSKIGRGQPGNSYILTDASATFSAIRAKFQSLASSAVSGDIVLYYHSSHGGYDESTKTTYICAHDNLYLDTEFADDLARFASGVKVVVVLDTCHSAGMFRDLGAWTFAERVQAMVNERIAKAGNGERASASIGWITAADWNEASSDLGWYDAPYGHVARNSMCTPAPIAPRRRSSVSTKRFSRA